MERLPLFDAQAPIACTLSPAEMDERIALFDGLRKRLSQLDRTEHGLLLRFPAEPALEATLDAFVLDEKRCCSFWGLQLERSDADLVLRWDAPPAARPILARFEAFFSSREPAEVLRGVL